MSNTHNKHVEGREEVGGDQDPVPVGNPKT